MTDFWNAFLEKKKKEKKRKKEKKNQNMKEFCLEGFHIAISWLSWPENFAWPFWRGPKQKSRKLVGSRELTVNSLSDYIMG